VNGITNTNDFENHSMTHAAVTIVYDGDGNRVSETAGGATTTYLVDTLLLASARRTLAAAETRQAASLHRGLPRTSP
jgi:hypothetical protein